MTGQKAMDEGGSLFALTRNGGKDGMKDTTKQGSVMVLGGGIAGVQAALDLAGLGYYEEGLYRRGNGTTGQDIPHQRLFHMNTCTKAG